MPRPQFANAHQVLDLDGEVHLWDFGGSGPPMVLVHGLGGSRANWSAVAGDFAKIGRVVVPDLIGFGDTPPMDRSPGVRRQAELVVDLIEHLDAGPAILIGNSMGGLVSMLVAAQRPDLVARMVLVGAAAPSSRPHFRPTAFIRLGIPLLPGIGGAVTRYLMTRGDVESSLAETMDFVMVDPSRLRDADRELALEFGTRRRAMPWAIDAFRDAARSIAAALVPPQRLSRELGKITAPTLVVQGEGDLVVPPQTAEWLISQRSDWDLHLMADVGHVPQLEAPDQFTTLVSSWLQPKASSSPSSASSSS